MGKFGEWQMTESKKESDLNEKTTDKQIQTCVKCDELTFSL